MTAKKAAAKSATKPTFSEARARLDEILEALERDSDDVDQLAARIKEAAELIRLCRERLSAARHEVRDVVAELAAETPAGGSLPVEEEMFIPDEEDDQEGEETLDDGTLPF